MPLNEASFEALERSLPMILQDRLSDAVGKVEQWIKHNHNWRDDTGSLTASVRGYVVGYDDPFKYFDDDRWKAAREGRRKSRYLSMYPENTPDHYQPHVEQIEVGESDNNVVGIITAFVAYGEDVENALLTAGTFSEAQYDVAQTALADAFKRPAF